MKRLLLLVLVAIALPSQAQFVSVGSPSAEAFFPTNDARYGVKLPLVELSKSYGYDLPSRDMATGTTLVTLLKDTPRFRIFVPEQDMVVTQIAMASTGTVSAGLTFARFFIYHVGHLGSQTDYTEMSFLPIARTANDTTMFNVANTLYQKNLDSTGGWPSSVRLVKGERYAVGYMIVGTTAPTVVSAAAFMRAQSNGTTVFPLLGGGFGGMGVLTDIADYSTGASIVYEGTVSSWFNMTCNPASTLRRPYVTALLGESYFGSYAGFFGFANAQAGSRLLPVLNGGVGGEQVSHMAARIAPILAVNPQVVVLHGGINDVANTRTAAAIEADITSIITAVTATGAKLIICTIPPSTSMDAGELVTLAAVNTWIKAITTTNVYIADTGNALTTGDGVTRDAAKYVDGAHPNLAGRQAMANVLDDVIATVVASLGG